MKIKDVIPGDRVLYRIKISDNVFQEIHYIRVEGFEEPNWAKIARVRTVQGELDGRILHDSGEYFCIDPGKVSENLEVVPFGETIFLNEQLNPKISNNVETFEVLHEAEIRTPTGLIAGDKVIVCRDQSGKILVIPKS